MKWYYALDGGRQGPISDAELDRLITGGQVGDATLVWKQGMGTWQPYGEVKGSRLLPPALPALPAQESSAADVGPVRARLRYVGFWRRFFAKIIDRMLVGVIVGFIGFFFFASQLLGQNGEPDPIALFLMQLVLLALDMVFSLAITWFFMARFEATPGKLALGIKVVRSDGQKLTNGTIFGRFFAEGLSGLIVCIGYLMVAFDREEHKALHDTVCNTRVIYK